MIRRWYGLKYHLSTGILASNGRDGPNFSREHRLAPAITSHHHMWLINRIMDQLIESRIDQAIDAVNDGFYSNCAQAARRLQRRFKGVGSRTSRAPTNKALTEEQEQAIMRYIDQLDKGEHVW